MPGNGEFESFINSCEILYHALDLELNTVSLRVSQTTLIPALNMLNSLKMP